MSQEKKSITVRLDPEIYQDLLALASNQNRSLANLFETMALETLQESMFVDDFEMDEIKSNTVLLKNLKTGSHQVKSKKGRFV